MVGFRVPALPVLTAAELDINDLVVVFDVSADKTKAAPMVAIDALAATKVNASAIGIAPTADNMGAFSGVTIPDNSTAKTALQALETSLDQVRAPGGAGLIGAAPGMTVADYLRYLRSSTGSVRWGYDDQTASAATVKMGSNTGLDGTSGVMQIGGAGPKDGGHGSFLTNNGHPNWNVLQSGLAFNATALNIYGGGTGGIAVANGTTTVTRATGPAWGPHMINRTFWFDGVPYTVVGAGADTVTLATAVPAGTKAWTYVVTTGTGTCLLVAGTCTRVTGDPFINHTLTSDTFEFTLNGSPYTVTASGPPDTCTIASPPPNGSYTYAYRTNINNQIASLRLQLTAGASEESLLMHANPAGYVIGAQFTGSGRYRSLFLQSEGQNVVELANVGKFVSLGGVQNAEALRVVYTANVINRFDAFGAPTGVAPSFRSRGADPNINAGIDMQGTGMLVVTNQTFGGVVFRASRPNAANDWVDIAAATTAPSVMAAGNSTNVDLLLGGKGTGLVRFGTWTANADAPVTGYITIKDAAGNTRKIPTIA